MFNLLNAVDNQSWDLWGGGRSKVSQGVLHTKYNVLYVGNMKVMKHYGVETCDKSMRKMYLCVLDGSANSNGITGQRTVVTTLWVGHNPAILAAKVHLAKLCSSSTWCTKLRLDHLSDRRNTVPEVSTYFK